MNKHRSLLVYNTFRPHLVEYLKGGESMADNKTKEVVSINTKEFSNGSGIKKVNPNTSRIKNNPPSGK